MYLIICLIANNLCVFVNSGQYPSCGAPISARVSSTLRKVLQFDAESTPVLLGEYWSTDRTVLGKESPVSSLSFGTAPAALQYLSDDITYESRPGRNEVFRH
jgi:hypothetical protein